MNQFKCPKCGGKYWSAIFAGHTPMIDYYACQNLIDGGGMSAPDVAMDSEESFRVYLSKTKGLKPCGAKFTRKEMVAMGAIES